MNVPAVIAVIGLTCIAATILGYITARVKRRNPDAWAFACFVFPPLLLILLLLPKPSKPYDREAARRKRLERDLADMWDD